MDMSGKLHAPAALSSGTEPVDRYHEKQKNLCHRRELILDPVVVQPAA
jgi:hypothetical protein